MQNHSNESDPIIYRRNDGKMQCKHCRKIKSVWGVEYSYMSKERYDGVSEWWCNESVGGCGIRMGRWTCKILKDKEEEPRLGETRKKRK
jgi:hypothetical protein